MKIKTLLCITVISLININANALTMKTIIYQHQQTITVTRDKAIPNCAEHKLANKITLIVSKYCHSCKKTGPHLAKLIKELKLQKQYQILDLSKPDDAKKVAAMNIRFQFVPTLIVNCKSYIGLRSDKEYRKILTHK